MTDTEQTPAMTDSARLASDTINLRPLTAVLTAALASTVQTLTGQSVVITELPVKAYDSGATYVTGASAEQVAVYVTPLVFSAQQQKALICISDGMGSALANKLLGANAETANSGGEAVSLSVVNEVLRNLVESVTASEHASPSLVTAFQAAVVESTTVGLDAESLATHFDESALVGAFSSLSLSISGLNESTDAHTIEWLLPHALLDALGLLSASAGAADNGTSQITVKPVQFGALDGLANSGVIAQNLSIVQDILLNMTVELGRSEITLKEVLELSRGSVIELDRLAGEAVDLLANGKLIAKGEIVVIEDSFGFRITNIVSPQERLMPA